MQLGCFVYSCRSLQMIIQKGLMAFMKKAKYWIAKYIPDLLRDEPRNVGVLVARDEDRAARFFGENENAQIDGRSIRDFQFPEVYRQWVEYWRYQLESGKIEETILDRPSNYRLIASGEVTDIGKDSAKDIAQYLYYTLVDSPFSLRSP